MAVQMFNQFGEFRLHAVPEGYLSLQSMGLHILLPCRDTGLLPVHHKAGIKDATA